MGTAVGLKALPLNVHLQFRGFLHLGDTFTSTLRYVHMHITIAGTYDVVKFYSHKIAFKNQNIISFYNPCQKTPVF
jgi:hypothetical protein